MGYSRMVKHLPRKRCNIVMPDNPSTTYCDAAPGSEALARVENKSASSQARPWQPAHFVLKSVIEDAWHPSNA
jgi:hypothetical protein